MRPDPARTRASKVQVIGWKNALEKNELMTTIRRSDPSSRRSDARMRTKTKAKNGTASHALSTHKPKTQLLATELRDSFE
jgi:murein L,D-transpeptidase YafK